MPFHKQVFDLLSEGGGVKIVVLSRCFKLGNFEKKKGAISLLSNTIFNYPCIHWYYCIWATNSIQKMDNKRRLVTTINK